jgi:hypothetical protein
MILVDELLFGDLIETRIIHPPHPLIQFHGIRNPEERNAGYKC